MKGTGFFISLEAIDCLGKTTQAELLEKELRSLGYDVYMTKEPGDRKQGSAVGQGIRDILFHTVTTHSMRPGVADLLFLADHIQNAGDVKDAVAQGKIVLSDRYADSQFAYVAAGNRKCPEGILKAYRDQYGIVPDLTILFVARGPSGGTLDSLPPQTLPEDISWALARNTKRSALEQEKQAGKSWNNVEDQRRIQNAYLHQLANKPRTHVINVWSDTTVADIHSIVMDIVHQRLLARELHAITQLPLFSEQPQQAA